MLAGRTQSEIPDAADHVFVAAISDAKVYVAYGAISPGVTAPAYIAIRTGFNQKADQADDDLRSGKINRKAYDRLGNLRQKGEDAYRHCFSERMSKQAAFAATLNKR